MARHRLLSSPGLKKPKATLQTQTSGHGGSNVKEHYAKKFIVLYVADVSAYPHRTQRNYLQCRTPTRDFNRKLMARNVALGFFELGDLENLYV